MYAILWNMNDLDVGYVIGSYAYNSGVILRSDTKVTMR
jgi:hypothetical protein